jgi:hypothetical protein
VPEVRESARHGGAPPAFDLREGYDRHEHGGSGPRPRHAKDQERREARPRRTSPRSRGRGGGPCKPLAQPDRRSQVGRLAVVAIGPGSTAFIEQASPVLRPRTAVARSAWKSEPLSELACVRRAQALAWSIQSSVRREGVGDPRSRRRRMAFALTFRRRADHESRAAGVDPRVDPDAGRSSRPLSKRSTLQRVSQSRRPDSNRGPLHYE